MNRGISKIASWLLARWLTLVALAAVVIAILAWVQFQTGSLWTHEIPLTEEMVLKKDGGSYRFSVSRLNVSFPERLETDSEVFEDGTLLNRVGFRNQILRSPDGCYVWTGASLWVAPLSGEPRGLVLRFPVAIRESVLLVLSGIAFVAILGVAISTSQRKVWRNFFTNCAGVSRKWAASLRKMANHHVVSRPHQCDLIAIGLLALIGGLLFFPLVDRTSQSYDGFLLTYLLERGDLLLYNVNEAKEPGRPFLGLAWHMAAALGGGSVSGYYAFQFSCLILSAILVYAVIRTLLPRQPAWAFLAAALKMVWIANYEVFDNSGLAIYFVETLFWLALLLYSRLIVRRERMPRVEILEVIVIAFALVVVIGTYQTSWLLVLLVPISMLGLGLLKWGRRRTVYLLSVWYFACLPMMTWCTILSLSYADRISVSPQEFFMRVLSGFWAATGESIYYSFAQPPGLPDFFFPGGKSVYVILGVFTVAWVWFSLGSFSELRKQSIGSTNRVLLFLFSLGIVIVLVTLLPPSLRYLPTFGTRFMHWAGVGSIIAFVAVFAWLSRMKAPMSGVTSVVLAILFFSGTVCLAFNIASYRTENSLINRRFWENLILELPKVERGTVILTEGLMAGVVIGDAFGTWVFRTLTDTKRTFFVSETTPEYDPVSQTYEISSVLALDPEGFSGEPMGDKPFYRRHDFPNVFDGPHVSHIPENRVVWLSWDLESRRLRVDPERSAMDRVMSGVPTEYGRLLFPRVAEESSSVPTGN